MTSFEEKKKKDTCGNGCSDRAGKGPDSMAKSCSIAFDSPHSRSLLFTAIAKWVLLSLVKHQKPACMLEWTYFSQNKQYS